MRTWRAFIEFQNDVAYAGGLPDPPPGAAEELARQPMPAGGTLIIGPGGVAEVAGMRPLFPELFGAADCGHISTLSGRLSEAWAIAGACSPWATAYFGDMHDMPFDDATFDYLYCSNVGEHAAMPPAWALEMRRVLKPGARASISLPGFEGVEGGVGPYHWHCLPEHCWRELFRKSGIAVDEVRIEVGTPALQTGHYMHFRCTAGDVPESSAYLVRRIRELRRT